MLNLSFAGTMGADAETRSAGSSEVTEFRVAVNGYDRKAKTKTTTWLKVNVWGQRGSQLAGLVSKGSKVAGSGLLEVQTYTSRAGETKTSFVVTAQDLTIQSFAERDEPKGKATSAAVDDSDDALPF